MLLQEELERKSENMINTGGRRRQHNMQDLVTPAVFFCLHLPHTFLFRPFMWIRAEALLGTWDTGI